MPPRPVRMQMWSVWSIGPSSLAESVFPGGLVCNFLLCSTALYPRLIDCLIYRLCESGSPYGSLGSGTKGSYVQHSIPLTIRRVIGLQRPNVFPLVLRGNLQEVSSSPHLITDQNYEVPPKIGSCSFKTVL
ncbi:hypothetical protein AVEN_78365-1 [Araneus ventricosus]|uniref:Uncharacterized protein n=1 Tax=Araneus ventricosus TaxID=182803 RepID=A0A4Y2MB91_ARAVE|nr:hypothetical protein AVEN_185001-1 [Araneus ventricosus]GBN23853.1 hypothetical protein AVEN_78365-1 [Araneus ventricosus]